MCSVTFMTGELEDSRWSGIVKGNNVWEAGYTDRFSINK